ncbi:MAG: UDP-N-acetylmuramate dehydrogenase [Patescibacteria group bacterium]|nr:UDP-N-acetylmuramate dehydrogenase [Patescibacteria group bacterium]
MTPEQNQKFQKNFPSILVDELMSKHINMRIGGPASLYLATSDVDELTDAIEMANKEKIPWFIFGGGSNLLVSDDGFDGLAIQVAFREVKVREKTIIVDAGAITGAVARQSVADGLEGMEWAATLPGTIGGAIYGNSGCWGGEMKDIVVTVDAIHLPDMKRVVYPNAKCKFGYRDSVFKHEPHIILRATLGLKKSEDPSVVNSRMEEFAAKRKECQPFSESSAGCMFKNFTFKDESELERLKNDVKEIPPEMLAKKSLSAGWLVSQVGMKGEKIGEAQISEKHGNFIVNLGNARAQDVLMLTSKAKMKVRDEYNIMLEDEVRLIGFDS